MSIIDSLDGQLYVFDNLPPDIEGFEGLGDEDPLEFDLLEVDSDINLKSTGRNVLFERTLFKIKDPTSLPHTRKRCGKWAKPMPGVKICVGWTIQYRWIYRIGSVKIATISEAGARSALEKCLKEAAVVALIGAIVSGGVGAVAAGEAALSRCLTEKLGDKLISVSINVRTHRGGWE